jgi:hypothetical protein
MFMVVKMKAFRLDSTTNQIEKAYHEGKLVKVSLLDIYVKMKLRLS